MDTKNDEMLAYVNALKYIDYEKEYQSALRDIAETILDMEFDDENNEPIVSPNEEYDEER